MGTLDELLRQLDPDPRRRGEEFERICKWFLTNDPVYGHELRRVWLWNDWPGRWDIDAGIDLVAEDREGRLWAIQAKAYDPAYRVTKRDVNKFLAESGRATFSYRMVIATTNLIDRIGERTIQDQEKRVTFFRLNALQAADVDWPSSPTALRPARTRKVARPHDYQRQAVRNVTRGFATGDRGQLIMACGTGKTLTALFIREKLAAERTLVLLPSLSLLKQTLNVWRSNGDEFSSLPVCSDYTVAQTEEDAAVSHTSDLGVPVTTDPQRIASFLRRRSGSLVVFATYQSSAQIAKAFALGQVPAFDLVIADEAHRCAGPASSDFATVLDPAKIRTKRRLFMTATPRYFTGRVLKAATELDFEYASMDDEAKFGPVFHRLGFSEAIRRGLLTDYQVEVVGVDDATYRDWAERAALVTVDGVKVTDARTLAGQIGLAKAVRKFDLRRTISFHSRVRSAKQFADSMPGVIAWMPSRQRPSGQLWSAYASGEMPAGERYVLLHRLGELDEGQRGLLSNARCLAEGVDVPTLDGVAFIDPRRSEVDIVQAVGRAIRKSDAKALGTIVIPVFVEANSDAEIALDDSIFKPVWDVIKALRSHDEVLGEQLDELRRELGRSGKLSHIPGKIHLDLPARVGVNFARAFGVRLVNETTSSWEYRFGALEKFVERHGHAHVPASYTVADFHLGAWVVTQRSRYARDRLDADRKRRLQALPGWTWGPHADNWEEGFTRLAQYVEVHGDARVHGDHVVDGYKLGQWVTLQRGGYNKGTLEADRKRRLEAVPGWTWNAISDQWEEGFARLVDFVESHGHARVPQPYVLDGYQLGAWVNTQRSKHAKGTSEPDRDERLQAVPGWTWGTRADKWEEGFGRLAAYVESHGNARVPRGYTDDGYKLGLWVANQRAKRDILNADRLQRLNHPEFHAPSGFCEPAGGPVTCLE
jgi:superfamily II DNA or RNA helicase